ncbi:cordon-bleu protein-like 1b [Misgurnus anguillicaudatus]|uniref:cordon-bleu protein-like 1b n=1 Tax=Misgurnus anguillicaudatus TaxID=75329 RepID=UPI003CCFD370
MTVDSTAHRGPSSAVDLTATDGMDGETRNRRRSSKHKAPPPPPVLKGLDAPVLSSHKLSAYPHPSMDQKENSLEKDLTLTVVLPGGVEKNTVVNGSKPMMDLLVTLCAKYHLNPSGHTIELITTNRNHVKFKPNALIGSLEAEKILLKPKGLDDRSKKAGPQMPEATVRLVIDYKRTQKTILRVSPRVPLRDLLPAICEKCEFDPQSTVLLRNVHSEDTLDLNCSLNDFGLREVYARDTRVFIPVSPVSLPPSPTRSDTIRRRKDKENKGMFGLFRKGSRKHSEQSVTVSAPASPIQRRQRPMSLSSFSTHSQMYDSNTMPSEMPKKRRAPLPPNMMSQSTPVDLSHHQENNETARTAEDGDQMMSPSSQGPSTESRLRRASTKRKAPPPPTLTSVDPPDEAAQDRSVTEPVLASPLEEIREQEEVLVPREGHVSPGELEDDSSLNLSADISLDSATQNSEMESVSPHGTSRDDPSHDISADPGPPDIAVNGVQSDQVMSQHVPSQMDPLEERIEKATQSSESSPVPEVSVSAASPLNTPQMSDCGVQTSLSHTDSDSVAPQTVPKSSPEPGHSSFPGYQTQTRVGLTNAAIQTQTDSTTISTESPSGFCTELPAGLPTSSPELKRDMSTSTEELHVPEPKTTTTQSRMGPASPPTATKADNVQYKVDAEPKPKSSNELTREYIPKVGMTTYTIVPQKSLEKLRYFEVELTLERPADAGKDSPDSKTFSPPPGHLPQLTNGTSAFNGHQRFSRKSTELTRSVSLASPRDDVFSPSSPSPVESVVKEKKVPPAIKPKPASFRLPQHKRTPGDYVTSAVVRRASFGSSSSGGSSCSSPVARSKEASSRPQSDIFPPSPEQWEGEEDAELRGSKPEHAAKEVEGPRFPPASCLTRQKSLPAKPSMSLEKLRSFAAPKPYSPSTPSRFAQAVLSAVKRSQSLHQRPPGHTSSIIESPELPETTVTDNGEESAERYREAPSQRAGHGEPAQSSTRNTDMGTYTFGNTQPPPGSGGSLASSSTLKGILETSLDE